MIEFKNDEDGYFAWLTSHPTGFVLNVRASSGQGFTEPTNNLSGQVFLTHDENENYVIAYNEKGAVPSDASTA